MAHSPRFLNLVNDAKSRVREVDLATILAWREEGQPFTLLDVREESEWAEDRIPGAVYLGRGVLESHLTTMASGLCPPLTIAVDVIAWLRATHPELIEAGAFR